MVLISDKAFPDLGIVTGWFRCRDTEGIIKPPSEARLLLTSIIDEDKKLFRTTLKEQGWKPAGWYPSCHEPMNGKKVWLYYKEQKKAALFTVDACSPHISLHCSVVHITEKTPDNISWYSSRHRVIGLQRLGIDESPTSPNKDQWRKFATTSLASYWIWALEPKEKDLYKLEPNLRPKAARAGAAFSYHPQGPTCEAASVSGSGEP